MALDVTSIDFRSRLHGLVFDVTDTDAVTQILAYDTSTRVLYVHKLELGCLSGRLLFFDHSMAGGKCLGRLRCVSQAYVADAWNFEDDPLKVNPCVSVGAGMCISANAAVVHGFIKFELGA